MIGDRKYLDDYVVETVEVNGKPKERSVYVGSLYAYDSPRLAARLLIFLAAVGVVFVAAFLTSGFFALENNVFYVLIPYVLQIIPVGLFVTAIIELMIYGVVIKACDKKKTLDRIRPICLFQAVFAVLAAVGDVCFVAFDPAFNSAVYECVFISCNLLSAFAACIASFVPRELNVHETVNREKDRITRAREKQREFDALLELERREKQRELSRAINQKKNRKKKK